MRRREETERRGEERSEGVKRALRGALALDGGEQLLVCARLPGGLAAALRLVAAPDEQPLLLEAPVREALAHELERAARPVHQRLDEREHVGQRGRRVGRTWRAERRVQLRLQREQLRLRLRALSALRHLLCTPWRTTAHELNVQQGCTRRTHRVASSAASNPSPCPAAQSPASRATVRTHRELLRVFRKANKTNTNRCESASATHLLVPVLVLVP